MDGRLLQDTKSVFYVGFYKVITLDNRLAISKERQKKTKTICIITDCWEKK